MGDSRCSLVLPSTVLLVAFVLGACGEGRQTTAPVSGQRCPGQSALYIAAHQDDDLLFMSPDLLQDVREGLQVRTLFLTTGDGGKEEAYWRGREMGIQAAYARMARVKNEWRSSIERVAGQRVSLRTLIEDPRVSLVFFRLPDGNLRGQGYPSTGEASLDKLWNGLLPHLTSLDGASSFSRPELITALTEWMERSEADCVATLDGGGLYEGDHSDHRHSAKFAFEAHRGFTRPHLLSQYRGYNMRGEPVNLSPQVREEKWEVFSLYAQHDPHLCRFGGTDCLPQSPYAQWSWRQYGTVAVRSVAGPLGGLDGRCLDAAGGSPAPGSPVRLRACTDAAASRWRLLETGQLQGPGGQCLEIPEGQPAADALVRLGGCVDAPRQKWTLLGDGQLRGPEDRCLEVREEGGGEGGDGLSVGMGACADVPRQRWTPRFGRVKRWASPETLPAPRLVKATRTVRSFQLADVSGDGLADACVVLPEGLTCAPHTGEGAFGTFRLVLAGFAPARLQFGDLDRDGRADVCARSPAGVSCATARGEGLAFTEPRVWTADFPDAPAPGTDPRPFVLADLDADGYADVCARSEEGVRCALNDRAGGFAAATVWLDAASTAQLAGPWPERAGRNLLVGDLNRDGRVDVCGRSEPGVHCALANASATGFEDLHLWSFRAELSDAEGWDSAAQDASPPRLADIDGDGLADLCARRAGVLVCGLSGGSRFQRLQSFQPRGCSAAEGWGLPGRQGSLVFGALDRNGHADVCGWGEAGPVCALAP